MKTKESQCDQFKNLFFAENVNTALPVVPSNQDRTCIVRGCVEQREQQVQREGESMHVYSLAV